MANPLNGHAKMVESVASWAIRIVIALLAWSAVDQISNIKSLAYIVDRIDKRLVRVEVKVEESNRRLNRVEKKVDDP